MTALELRKLFNELLRRNNIIAEIEKKFERSLVTGAINYENDDPKNFGCLKLYCMPSSLEIADRLPLTWECKEEGRNLQKFL